MVYKDNVLGFLESVKVKNIWNILKSAGIGNYNTFSLHTVTYLWMKKQSIREHL